MVPLSYRDQLPVLKLCDKETTTAIFQKEIKSLALRIDVLDFSLSYYGRIIVSLDRQLGYTK